MTQPEDEDDDSIFQPESSDVMMNHASWPNATANTTVQITKCLLKINFVKQLYLCNCLWKQLSRFLYFSLSLSKAFVEISLLFIYYHYVFIRQRSSGNAKYRFLLYEVYFSELFHLFHRSWHYAP